MIRLIIVVNFFKWILILVSAFIMLCEQFRIRWLMTGIPYDLEEMEVGTTQGDSDSSYSIFGTNSQGNFLDIFKPEGCNILWHHCEGARLQLHIRDEVLQKTGIIFITSLSVCMTGNLLVQDTQNFHSLVTNKLNMIGPAQVWWQWKLRYSQVFFTSASNI